MTPAPPAPVQSSGSLRGAVIGLVIAVVVFLVLACGATMYGYSSLQRERAEVRKGWNLVPVIVAAVDIAENTVVTMEMISQRSVPEQFVTSSVIKPDSASYIVNQKVLVAIQAGDPLLWSQFETTKAAERLSTKVPEPDRIIAVKASGEFGVAGWLRPNDHVDVIAVYVAPDTKELTSVTLLENVVIVAVGRITGTTNVNVIPEKERGYSEVSLLLSPENAEKVALMANLGTLTLALRNENSTSKRPNSPKQTVKSVTGGR
ncbi:MAG: Flp pilus assembly protein CpaB [Archangium sp.]